MIAALIVAAGQGVRMGSRRRKQYLTLGDRPILAHTLQIFDGCRAIDRIAVAVPAQEIDFCRRTLTAGVTWRAPITWIAGGARRQDSVYNGLQALGAEDGIVLIHDGVRPLITAALIERCIQGAQKWGACIPVVPVTDTLKRVGSDGTVERTVSRERLSMAQTPQAFRLSLVLEAHRHARQNDWQATDDASLVERLGADVHVVAGSANNIKITTPEDLRWAEVFLDS